MDTNTKNEIDINEIIVSTFVFIRRKFKILLLFFLIGLSIAIYKKFFTKPSYETSLTAYTKVASEQVIQAINSLKDLILEKNYLELSKKTGLSKEVVIKLKSIEADYYYPEEEIIENDLKARKNYIKVTARINDNNITKELQAGIVHCVENNRMVKIIFQSNRDKLKVKIDSAGQVVKLMEKEAEKKSKLLTDKQNSSMTFLGSDPVYKNILGIHNSIIDNKFILKYYKPIIITNDFYKPLKNKKSLIKNLIIWVGIFMVLALLIIFVIDYNKKAIEQLKKK